MHVGQRMFAAWPQPWRSDRCHQMGEMDEKIAISTHLGGAFARSRRRLGSSGRHLEGKEEYRGGVKQKEMKKFMRKLKINAYLEFQ